MSTRLKALRTLVRTRERQAAALKAALDQARGEHAIGQQRLAQAIEHERACTAAEAAGHADMDRLTRAAFTPEAQRAMAFRIEDLKAAAAQAARAVGDTREAVARLALGVEAAQAAVRRNEQRIEGFREQIEALQREREAALEEQAEEETEEASTARFVARTRAAAAEASHG